MNVLSSYAIKANQSQKLMLMTLMNKFKDLSFMEYIEKHDIQNMFITNEKNPYQKVINKIMKIKTFTLPYEKLKIILELQTSLVSELCKINKPLKNSKHYFEY